MLVKTYIYYYSMISRWSLGNSDTMTNQHDQGISSEDLKLIYHPLYSMNKFVTNKSKLSQDGVQVFPYMPDWLSCDHLRGSHDSQSPPYMG